MRILFLEHCMFSTYFPVEITEMRTPEDILATYCCFMMHTSVQELINGKAREISVLESQNCWLSFRGKLGGGFKNSKNWLFVSFFTRMKNKPRTVFR